MIEDRQQGNLHKSIYEFPGVGRIIYTNALGGLIRGEFKGPEDFPSWLRLAQAELAEWLRETPKRKSQYFLAMANLESYDLLPYPRSDPRGQYE